MNSPASHVPAASPMRLAFVWAVGFAIGTLLVAVSSPLFVRTYLPLSWDAVRNTWTLRPGSDYRWRSEGYATTRIGPHGMPGRRSLPSPESTDVRVALWGDSQAEGVCIEDGWKPFAQAERLAQEESLSLAVLPLARSGENAATWLSQIQAVESAFEIDLHVFLIVDLPDLLSATDARPRTIDSVESADRGRNAIASQVPAFVIQAARNLVTDQDGTSPRKLRFSVGPEAAATGGRDRDPDGSSISRYRWAEIMNAFHQACDRPVVLLHAPPIPKIVGGRMSQSFDLQDELPEIKRAAAAAGIEFISVDDALLQAANRGNWPHGYHNGQIGVGHLNATGYAIVANALVNAAERITHREGD
ncbi:MAG: SGNH/GDSL hydrolase family protein [Planctomycetota bacterium]